MIYTLAEWYHDQAEAFANDELGEDAVQPWEYWLFANEAYYEQKELAKAGGLC